MCSCQRQQVPPVLLAVPVDDTQKKVNFFSNNSILYSRNYLLQQLLSVGDTVSKSDYKS